MPKEAMPYLAKSLSDWEVVEAYQAHSCGTSMSAIARRYRVSAKTISRAFARLEDRARERGYRIERAKR